MTQAEDSVMRLEGVTGMTGESKSTIYAKMNPDSRYFDPDFPKPIKLGRRSVGWWKSEVLRYLQSRPRADQ